MTAQRLMERHPPGRCRASRRRAARSRRHERPLPPRRHKAAGREGERARDGPRRSKVSVDPVGPVVGLVVPRALRLDLSGSSRQSWQRQPQHATSRGTARDDKKIATFPRRRESSDFAVERRWVRACAGTTNQWQPRSRDTPHQTMVVSRPSLFLPESSAPASSASAMLEKTELPEISAITRNAGQKSLATMLECPCTRLDSSSA